MEDVKFKNSLSVYSYIVDYKWTKGVNKNKKHKQTFNPFFTQNILDIIIRTYAYIKNHSVLVL